MNAKQLGILVVLAVVLGAAVWIWRGQNASSWSGSGRGTGQELLGALQVNDVAQVVISRDQDKVTLVKTPDRWVVKERKDFPAAFSDLKSLLLKLQGLKIVQTDEIESGQRARLDLADTGTNAATVLELRDAGGKVLRTLLLGKKHLQSSGSDGSQGWPDGRYLMTDAASGHVLLVADGLTEVEPAAANWVSKDFLKVEHVLQLAAQFPVATNSWSLSRTNESADWQLAAATAAEKLDTSKLGDLSAPLASLSLADVGSTPVAASVATLEAKTAEGLDYVFSVGSKTNDNYPVSFTVSGVVSTNALTPGVTLAALQEKQARESALTNWSYLVPSWTLDPVLKNRADWLVVATNAPAN